MDNQKSLFLAIVAVMVFSLLTFAFFGGDRSELDDSQERARMQAIPKSVLMSRNSVQIKLPQKWGQFQATRLGEDTNSSLNLDQEKQKSKEESKKKKKKKKKRKKRKLARKASPEQGSVEESHFDNSDFSTPEEFSDSSYVSRGGSLPAEDSQTGTSENTSGSDSLMRVVDLFDQTEDRLRCHFNDKKCRRSIGTQLVEAACYRKSGDSIDVAQEVVNESFFAIDESSTSPLLDNESQIVEVALAAQNLGTRIPDIPEDILRFYNYLQIPNQDQLFSDSPSVNRQNASVSTVPGKISRDIEELIEKKKKKFIDSAPRRDANESVRMADIKAMVELKTTLSQELVSEVDYTIGLHLSLSQYEQAFLEIEGLEECNKKKLLVERSKQFLGEKSIQQILDEGQPLLCIRKSQKNDSEISKNTRRSGELQEKRSYILVGGYRKFASGRAHYRVRGTAEKENLWTRTPLNCDEHILVN